MKVVYRGVVAGFLCIGSISGIAFPSYAQQVKPLQTLKHDRAIGTFAVTRNGKILATATDDMFSAKNHALLESKETSIDAFIANVGNQKPSEIVLWDTQTGKKLRTFTASSTTDVLTFSPNGELLASGSKSIDVWNVKTGSHIGTWTNAEIIKDIAFSPDGKLLSSVDADGILTQWTPGTGVKVKSWRVSPEYAFAVAYTQKGDVLITGGDYDGKLKFWDARKGTLLHSVKVHHNAIDTIAVSPDGTKVAAGSWDGTISVWDVRTTKLLFLLKGHGSNVWSVTFSPDSRCIGSLSSEIKVWDAVSGKLLKTIPTGNRNISFVGNNKTIASAEGPMISIRTLVP